MLISQLEKFIESIFPSQSPEAAKGVVKGEPTPEEKKKAEQEKEARQEVFFIMLIMFVMVCFVTAIMVSVILVRAGLLIQLTG